MAEIGFYTEEALGASIGCTPALLRVRLGDEDDEPMTPDLLKHRFPPQPDDTPTPEEVAAVLAQFPPAPALGTFVGTPRDGPNPLEEAWQEALRRERQGD